MVPAEKRPGFPGRLWRAGLLLDCPARSSPRGRCQSNLITLPVNLVTSPGSSVSTSLKVQNSGSEAVKLQVTLMKFKADSTNGQATLVPFKDGEEEKNWVTFSKTNFTAQPGVLTR